MASEGPAGTRVVLFGATGSTVTIVIGFRFGDGGGDGNG